MLMPKRVKWRKQQRGKIRGLATRCNTVAFGDFGLQSLEPGWIPSRTIEAARIACSRGAPEGRIWIRIFPHKSVTATPAETRLGTGKGEIEYWTAVVKPGTVIFEIGGVTEDVAKKAFNRVAHKLPVKTRLVRRRHL
jgi:large subunit ribosomal protein L16